MGLCLYDSCPREGCLRGLVVLVTSSSAVSPFLLQVFTEGLFCSTHPLQPTPATTDMEIHHVTHLQRQGKPEVQGYRNKALVVFPKISKDPPFDFTK